MTAAAFIDTNILLYAISQNEADTIKRSIACVVLERDDLCLSVQILQEFYVQATHSRQAVPLTHAQALAFLDVWCRFPVQEQTLGILQRALEIKHRYQISYWDGAIIAAADALGCETLMSEDMQHGQQFGGVRVENPFRKHA